MTQTELWLMGAAGITAGALVMTVINLRSWPKASGLVSRGPTGASQEPADLSQPLISVCVPARNEEVNIEACVRGLLANDYRNLEVLVYDDQSTDQTPRILQRLIKEDPRVRLVETVPLPAGWNGKQHACHRMATASNGQYMLFTDADVRFAPQCLSMTLAASRALDAPLLSTFPKQETRSLAERLCVPMIFFILLSYLPFSRMRRTNDPSASAGCGQFLFVRQDAYQAAGGHAAFKDSMHDGIKLPRAVRRAGFHSDLFDGTELCSCRMYFGFSSTWRGFAKNAYEGLGSVALLLFITVLHVVGHILPAILLILWALGSITLSPLALALAGGAVFISIVQRLIIGTRTQHAAWIAFLHPLAVLMMTAIQWHSYILHITGRRAWRGRVATAAAEKQVQAVAK